jgi:diguanylate cyclase (GGDEF)-like protein
LASQRTTGSTSLTTAEVVAWQSSRRIMLAAGIAVAVGVLRALGIARGWLWPIVVAIPAYVGLVALISYRIRQRDAVSTRALVLLAIADLTLIFATIAFAATPPFYAGALFLCLGALQFTQVEFGRPPALAIVMVSPLAYLALDMTAFAMGDTVDWVREGWILCVYLVVAVNALVVHASAERRLGSLVELFEGAKRGEFSAAFSEVHGREPDRITRLGRAYNHMRSDLATMVTTDATTGCLNRRGFEQLLDRAIGTADRFPGDVALLAIDVDHFKEINDSIGHLAGDSVLRDVAAVLTQSSRAGDVVARVGGDEFAILLPDTDTEMAGVVAERVLDAIRLHPFTTARGRRSVTVSVGIAVEAIADISAATALRARADEALYVSKRLGRNRVVMWAPGIRSNATPNFSAIVGPLHGHVGGSQGRQTAQYPHRNSKGDSAAP